MRRNSVSPTMKREIRELYGNRCVNCGSETDIELHHIVPIAVGGNHIPSNIVPLCHACHKAVTFEMPLIMAHMDGQRNVGGRKAIYPDNYEIILEDYTRCRISKSEAAERLGKSSPRFNGENFFVEYLKSNGIVKYRNNIDLCVSKKGAVYEGAVVGYIDYEDGRHEDFYWKSERAISGESKVPTAIVKERPKPITKFNTSNINSVGQHKKHSDTELYWREYRKSLRG